MKNTPRVFLLEDHPVMRLGLKMMLEERGYLVSGMASNPEEAMRGLSEVPAEVAIFDLSIGGETILEKLREFRSTFPRLSIIIYSMHDTPIFVESALRAGVNGYVTKADPVETLIEGISVVQSGKTFLGQTLSKSFHERIAETGELGNIFRDLSVRETNVLHMIGEGFGVSEMAQKLDLSPRTIETYMQRLRQKLKVKTNRELSRAAIKFLHSA